MNDMEYTDKEYCLEVWGDWACFTRPELKVERVSYDVITPSAARAIFVYLANLHTSFLCNLIYPTFSRILLYSC